MHCPQCSKEVSVLEAQYGALFTCPECYAVYFVNFEGQPEYGDMVEPVYESLQTVETEINQYVDQASGLNSELNAMVSDFDHVSQEITDYANQDQAISRINYDMIVRGLDSKEMRNIYKEAIDDVKFGWIANEVLAQIKNGESVLQNLNPLQAYVLASRLYCVDLDIEWKQNVAF